MIIKKICGEHIYLDETHDEFKKCWMGLSSFLLLGFGIVTLPMISNIFGKDAIIPFIIIIICLCFTLLYKTITSPDIVYDVWIPNEHRFIDKTGNNDDKIKIEYAVAELETIVISRINFIKELQSGG